MASLNKVMLIGNLGQDPEERTFQNGGGVVNLRLACSETWKDKNTGERKERTEWVTVAIFTEGLRKVAMDYLRKGSKVFIEGKLQTRKWQDQSGNDRYTTEVVLQPMAGNLILLGDGQGGGGGGGRARQQQQDNRPGGWENRGNDGYAGNRGGGTGGGFVDDLDDDIPF